MLTVMRDKLSGWITWIIIIVISLVFVLFGIGNYFQSDFRESKAVAHVGDESITLNQLQNVMRNLSQQSPDLAQNDKILREKALQSLIDSKVQVVFAQKMGVGLSAGQLDQVVYQIPAFQNDGKFSQEKFKYFLSRSGMSLPMIRDNIKQEAIVNQVAYGIAGSEFILPNEMSQFLNLMTQKRNIKQLNILSQDFKNEVKIPDEKVKAYYASHLNQFMTPAKVKIEYIELSLNSLKADVNPTESQVLAYYEANKQSFYKPEMRKYSQITLSFSPKATKNNIKEQLAKANKIIKQARNGKSFDKLVQEYTTDILAKKNKGNMGWVDDKSSDSIISTPLFSLSKVGDVSDPIKTQYGYEIIKLTGIKKAKQKSFSAVKKEIIETLKNQEAEKEYSSIGNQMSNLAFENPQSLDFVAEQLHLQVKELPEFTKKGLDSGIASNQKLIQAAFSSNVLRDKNNSNVINISNAKSVIIRLKKYTPETAKSFIEVKQQIINRLQQLAQNEMAKKEANKIKSELNAHKKIKQTYIDQFKEIKNISIENTDYTKSLIRHYMSAPLATKNFPNYQVMPIKNGYAVFAITDIINNEKDNEQKSKVYGRLLQQLYGAYIYQLYATYAKEQIPVKIKK